LVSANTLWNDKFQSAPRSYERGDKRFGGRWRPRRFNSAEKEYQEAVKTAETERVKKIQALVGDAKIEFATALKAAVDRFNGVRRISIPCRSR
jgi:hypothetical protein